MNYRIPFGNLKIGDSARRRISEIAESGWISEGQFVREFEEKFAAKFGWKYAIATSSGTDAGIVVWSAVRELAVRELTGVSWRCLTALTPACAFVATANCLLAARINPYFVDVSLETLNLDSGSLKTAISASYYPEVRDIGIQFVATMGKSTPVRQIAEIADKHDLWLVGDWCEAHGSYFQTAPIPGKEWTANYGGTWQYADHLCDASIYSFYAAHLIVGGEGGMICTDDGELAELCRSIKSHGRPAGSNYFSFDKVGFNSKWNELCAAVALDGLENFDENFQKRRNVRKRLYQMLVSLDSRFEKFILYPDGQSEIIAPHAFPLVLKDPDGDIRPLYEHLDKAGIQIKTLFGSLPTQHKAFEFLGHKLGDFPVAERIGRTGLHLPCNEFIDDEDIHYIYQTIRDYFEHNGL